jgi:hypothetical protein
MTETRCQIVLDFAKWTTLSALRSGAPIKAREDVYPLLDAVKFAEVLWAKPCITQVEFNDWHERETLGLCHRDKRLPTGWAVKMINVYLKTAVYVGDLGARGLRDALHPPVDSGLWLGISTRFRGCTDIIQEVCCVQRIKDITGYSTYRRIINGCRAAAQSLGCSLIEVEQLWLGAVTPKPTVATITVWSDH